MLKIIGLPDKPTPNKNNGSRLIFNKNNNSRPTSRRNNSNGKVDRFGIDRNDMGYAKKLGKLSKSKKLKSEKIFKF